MTYASTPSAPGHLAPAASARPATLLSAVWHAPSALVGWFVERRRTARAIATLESLSDSTLKDIGIERYDIPRIASQRGR